MVDQPADNAARAHQQMQGVIDAAVSRALAEERQRTNAVLDTTRAQRNSAFDQITDLAYQIAVERQRATAWDAERQEWLRERQRLTDRIEELENET